MWLWARSCEGYRVIMINFSSAGISVFIKRFSSVASRVILGHWTHPRLPCSLGAACFLSTTQECYVCGFTSGYWRLQVSNVLNFYNFFNTSHILCHNEGDLRNSVSGLQSKFFSFSNWIQSSICDLSLHNGTILLNYKHVWNPVSLARPVENTQQFANANRRHSCCGCQLCNDPFGVIWVGLWGSNDPK
jgi:hypothetical protein